MLEKSEGNTAEGAEEEFPDSDCVSQEEIEKAFQQKFYLQHEESLSLQKNYVLHICKSGKSVIAALSGSQIEVLDIGSSSLRKVHTEVFEKDDKICNVRFLHKDPQVFLSGQSSGSIAIHDRREGKVVATLEDVTSGSRKPFTTFDVNAIDRVICAGTEQILHDVFLLFFDVRQRKLLGGYWESHEDDVTSIEFHPRDTNTLATGSTDGLINIFDISKATEEDAMDYSLNTEKTVQKINWHIQGKTDGDLLTCIMDSNDFHVYETKDSQLVKEFSREDITQSLMRTCPEQCSTIGCHSNTSGGMFLMAGSNAKNGECLRMLEYRDKKLHPVADFIGNHQIIRSYIYDQTEDFYITGGENGIISLWGHDQMKPEERSEGVERRKSHKTVNPY